MSITNSVHFKSKKLACFDLEQMPAMVNVTFRIPLNFEDPREYKGTYDVAAIPLTFQDGEDGYAIYVAKRNENDVSNVIWSETIRMKGTGFVLSNDKHHKEHFPEGNHSNFSSYYHICSSQFMLRLNIAVYRPAPEKIMVKLIGPFSETY